MSNNEPKKPTVAQSIRSKLIGAPRERPRICDVEIEILVNRETGETEKVLVDVVAPTVAARSHIDSIAGYNLSKGTVEHRAAMETGYIIECTVAPGTMDPVFTKDDADAIAARATGDWPRIIWEEILALTRVNPQQKDDLKKKYRTDEIPSAST